MTESDSYPNGFDEDVLQNEHNTCPECSGRVTTNSREMVCDDCGLVFKPPSPITGQGGADQKHKLAVASSEGPTLIIPSHKDRRMPGESNSRVAGVDIADIREYLAHTDVVFAVLFGSHVRDDADADSDVDIVLRFPEDMDSRERFRRRNRIDVDLQGYSDSFVDVSDIESLPLSVAHAALCEGLVIAGSEQTVEAYSEQVKQAYEASAEERERERREFIDRLARGDT
jgi:predicted nucleotidyltransferase